MHLLASVACIATGIILTFLMKFWILCKLRTCFWTFSFQRWTAHSHSQNQMRAEISQTWISKQKSNTFPCIALRYSNQHLSQASLSAWLSFVLKFASVVQNLLWFHCYCLTWEASFFISSFALTFRIIPEQAKGPILLPLELFCHFSPSFESFCKLCTCIWTFNFQCWDCSQPRPESDKSGNQPKPDLKA